MKYLLLFVLLPLGLLAAGCSGVRPPLGVREGRLTPCPSTPNCVSSQSTDKEHSIEPLRFSGSPYAAMEKLGKIVSSMKRTKITEQQPGYIRVEFTSLIWRFVDDVEFLADKQAGDIHVRSASRIGRSDLGANRKRIEEIRRLWGSAGA